PKGGLPMKIRSRLFLPVCLAALVTLAVTAPGLASPCSTKTYELAVPDASTLHLRDGDHVIAAVSTEHGKLEVRVHVKGDAISENEFFLNGKPLRRVLESGVPRDVLKCQQLKASRTAEDWILAAANAVSTLVEHAAEARNTKCVYEVTATCYEYAKNQYVCAYRICCGTSCYIEIE